VAHIDHFIQAGTEQISLLILGASVDVPSKTLFGIARKRTVKIRFLAIPDSLSGPIRQ